MPELPEVETIARALRPEIEGWTITASRLLWKRTLASPSPKKFADEIIGQRIEAVTRRAKYLHLHLSHGHLLIHLRMSGFLWTKPADHKIEKHDRFVLTLSLLGSPSGVLREGAGGEGRKFLIFNDTRKFGRVWFTHNPEEVIGNLGPEPFDPVFTPQVLYARLRARHRQLKPLLLDQTFLAGLGNIYTDEALHLAKLHPLSFSNQITLEQARKLHSAVRTVLKKGIKHNGASIDWVYRGGSFQNYFRAYGRTGEPCPACGTIIVRAVVGQRGTHYCPVCQPLAR